jgi:WhiB family redox-sensing transcriptional regulator
VHGEALPRDVLRHQHQNLPCSPHRDGCPEAEVKARSALPWSDGAAGPVLNMFDELTDAGMWQERARCAEVDPELWFPEKGGGNRAAKRVCAACPVRAECLEYILRPENAEIARFGVWAGLSPQQRRGLREGPPKPATRRKRVCTHPRDPQNVRISDGGVTECLPCEHERYLKRKAAA